jgi:oligopeptide/dipeptide ABC transporter ATP-binding protein
MRLESERTRPLISVRGLCKHYPVRRASGESAVIRALENITFDVFTGEAIGIVGESGSGKSTLGKMILRLTDATDGTIQFDGTDVTAMSEAKFKPFRRKMQMVFQDPMASLNPRLKIRSIVGEGLTVHGIGNNQTREVLVRKMLGQVGLSEDAIDRYPHEFSGGQLQRIGIARALIVNPSLLIADEPVSSLDVSIQGQIINLLADFQKDLRLTLLFISHDLGVVQYISDRTIVMYLGHIVESAPTTSLFSRPIHPYTRALLSARTRLDTSSTGSKIMLSGEMPSPASPPSGCVFRTRCPYAISDCSKHIPVARELAPQHTFACLRDDLPWLT